MSQKRVSVFMGGTGANTAAGARSALGVVALAGDTMTGNLVMSGATVNTATANISTIVTGNALTISTGTSSNANIIFSANGAEDMRITAPGNVGIGTTNPTTRLEVQGGMRAGPSGNANTFQVGTETDGTVRLGPNIIFPEVGAGRLNIQDRLGAFISFYVSNTLNSRIKTGEAGFTNHLVFEVSGSDRLTITNTGSIGIGTTSPAERLHVSAGTIQIDGSTNGIRIFKNGSSSITSHLYIANAANDRAYNWQLNSDGSALDFWTYNGSSWNNRITYTANGNVGIGLTSPTSALHIRQTSSVIKVISSGNFAAFTEYQGNNGGAAEFYVGMDSGTGASFGRGAHTAVMWHSGNANMIFGTNNTHRGSILSTGEYVIGDTDLTTISTDRLHSMGSIGGRASLAAGAYARLVIQERVSNWISFVNGSGTHFGTISVSGAGVSYGSNSDYRLKENIIELTNAISRVKELKPKRFNFINEPEITQDGFLAHEVQDVVPEAVVGDKDGYIASGNIMDAEGNIVQFNVAQPKELESGMQWIKLKEDPKYQTLDTSYLVPLLTKALQEAIEKIEILENKVAALESGS